MKRLFYISIVIVIIGSILTYFVVKNPELEPRSKAPQIIDYVTPNLTDEQLEGKQYYNIHCAMCHRINGKGSSPSILKEHFKNYTFETFVKFLRNEKRDRINDYNAVCMPYPELRLYKIQAIYTYLEYKLER